jgi:hypothetical protein
MNIGKLINNYLVSLIWRWYSGVIAGLDLVGLVIIFTKNLSIPPWVYFTIIGVEFLFAGFLIYYDDQVKLQNLKEETQKEIESLKSKILELEDRIPKLSLFFKVGDECVQKQTITVQPKPAIPEFDTLVEEERLRVTDAYKSQESKLEKFSSDPAKRMDEMAKLMMDMPKKREDYDEECREYIKKYRSYLISKYNYELGQDRYRVVHFAVKNTGRTPGKEIVVVAHFPDSFYLFGDEDDRAESRQLFDYNYPPEKPAIPRVTQSIGDLVRGISGLDSIISSPMINTDVGPKNVGGPYIKHSKSTEIEYDLDELLHNFTEDSLNELHFIVLDEAVGVTWEIPYEIHASNLPTPISGSLWIQVIIE